MTKRTMKCTIILLLLSSFYFANSQSVADVNILMSSAPYTKQNVAKKYKLEQNQNEVQMVFTGLFRFYKYVISSQDMNVCTFSPSCSEYGLLCIREHGVMRGALQTLDRMMRCNPLSPEHYLRDQKTGLFIDKP